MKTVNGGLLIVIAFFVLWIGVTGRFPKLIAAIGLVRGNAPESPPKSGGNTTNTGTVPPVTNQIPAQKEYLIPTPEITKVWNQLWYNLTNQYLGAYPKGMGVDGGPPQP